MTSQVGALLMILPQMMKRVLKISLQQVHLKGNQEMVKMAIIPAVFVPSALMLLGTVSSSHAGTVLLVLHVELGNYSPPAHLDFFFLSWNSTVLDLVMNSGGQTEADECINASLILWGHALPNPRMCFRLWHVDGISNWRKQYNMLMFTEYLQCNKSLPLLHCVISLF